MGRPLIPVTIAVVACAVVVGGGCSTVLGIHDISAQQSACGLQIDQGACASCIASSCCSQAAACAGDMVCSAATECVLGCGSDPACRTQCAYTHGGTPTPTVPALNQCIASSCADACGLSCGLPIAPSPPDAAAACTACIGDHACMPAETCAKDLGCTSVSYCQLGCTTLDCHDACLDAYDGGAFVGFGAALLVGCQKACELGQNWVCLGSVAPGGPKVGPADVTMRLTDYSSRQPVPGLQVSACGAAQDNCGALVSSGTTDAQGRVTLTLPTISGVQLGFHGYFEVVPPQVDAGTGDAGASLSTLRMLYFPSSPLSVSHAHFDALTFTPAGLTNLAAYPKVQLVPGRGHLALQALDCLQEPASHVVFDVVGGDMQSKLVYVAGAVLDPLATETDISGTAAMFDVPPGPVTVEAKLSSSGTVTSRVSVFVDADALTNVALGPTPQ